MRARVCRVADPVLVLPAVHAWLPASQSASSRRAVRPRHCAKPAAPPDSIFLMQGTPC